MYREITFLILSVNYPHLSEEGASGSPTEDSCFIDSACDTEYCKAETESPQALIPAVPSVFVISI